MSTSAPPEFTVDAADIIRLVLGYLTSVGLHQSARTLREESGIGFSDQSLLTPALPSHIRQGEWGSVARALQLSQNPHPPLIQEQMILELAEKSTTLPLAQTLLALGRDELDQLQDDEEEQETTTSRLSKARSLEQRLAAIAANPKKYAEGSSERVKLLFGRKMNKQSRRNQVAAKLEHDTTLVPLNRLGALLQQACKWQSWTGQLPYVKQVEEEASNTSGKPKREKRKHYDLVLGTAVADTGVVVGESAVGEDDHLVAPIPSDVFAKVKFGKSAVCEAACFVTNGLITASSDGLIEIWDSSYQQLNTGEYAFQADDSVMGHDDTAVLALAVSHDQSLLASGDASGMVKLWNLQKGTCLRHYQAHSPTSSITALDWSRDASRLLTASSEGVCREFGIVSQHVLQEYTGHTSYIQSCRYVLEWKGNDDAIQLIVTGSADGTVRLWRQGQCIKIWQPQGTLTVGASIIVDATRLLSESPSIASVCSVPGRQNHLLVVARSSTAYLVDLVKGSVVQRYQAPPDKSQDVVFCAAAATADWAYLCTTANDCLVFGVQSGRLEQTIRDFGVDSTTKTTSSHVAEISQLLTHPFKSIVAAFSNDKTQKKGILAVWK